VSNTEGSSGPKASILPGPPHHVTIIQHKTKHKIHICKNDSKYGEVGTECRHLLNCSRNCATNYIMLHNEQFC